MRQVTHRYVITENCNENCPHCFNAEARDKGVIDADLFIEFVRKNSANLSSTRCLIMGGEPTLHPRIIEMVLEAAKHYELVDVFTNGSRLNKIAKHPDIIKDHFTDKICYVINGYAFDQVKYEEYKDFVKDLSLHFVITTWGHKEILEKIYDCMKYHDSTNLKLVISCDTQVDLFNEEELNNYRKIWLEFIKEIIPVIQSKGIEWQTDHHFPVCFFTQKMIYELNLIDLPNFHFSTSCCQCPDIGLIDWNWDFYYCNQTRIKLGSVLKKSGELKTLIELVNEYVTPAHGFKTECIRNLKEECKNCTALNLCRVGCYYNTLVKHCSLKGG